MTNLEIVEQFVADWAKRDIELIVSYFTEDALYHNLPMEPMTGTAAIREALTGFIAMASEIEWINHNVAESAEGVVLTERTDRFRINNFWLELPVMGTFELRDGKICSWRDYFDLKAFEAGMAAAAAG